MRLGIVGGKLQGLEATYLAGKAGWETTVLDRRPGVPAAGLCDRLVVGDATRRRDLEAAMEGVDLILPALEDAAALDSLVRWAEARGVPLAFDPQAFGVSSSKVLSGRLFGELAVPQPDPWPGCRFPVVAKPERGSGSRGVRVFRSPGELEAAGPPADGPEPWVLQEYLAGPSYSLEIVGGAGRYRTLQVTDLFMDGRWDCKRVIAPTELAGEQAAELERIAERLAESLPLRGLMDVEAILHEGRLKVLEIDARLPSQTPTAVFWSTGLNMVSLLADSFLTRPSPGGGAATDGPVGSGTPKRPRGVVYEHFRVRDGVLEVGGEHLIGAARGLRLEPGFFGAAEAITNYAAGADEWVATLINVGATRAEAWAHRTAVMTAIREQERIAVYRDPEPAP